MSETNENNNEATKTVDVGEGGSKNTPGFEGAWVVFALAFCVFLIVVFHVFFLYVDGFIAC